MNEPSQADWRPNPVAERTLIEDLSGERRRRTTLLLLIASGLVLSSVGCWGAFLAIASNGTFIGLWAGGIAAMMFIAAATQYAKGKERRHLRYVALQAEYGSSEGWIVEITIHQGEIVSGRDVGLVWFEDDRLFFTGARTSFALRPGDVEPDTQWSLNIFDRTVDAALTLRAESYVGAVQLGFRLLQDQSAHRSFKHTKAGFQKGLTKWIRSSQAQGGQLPPLTPGPDLPSLGSLRRRTILVNAIWIGIAASILGMTITRDLKSFVPITTGLISLLASWPVAVRPRRCRKAVRDRQKLDALAREAR